MLAQPVTIRVGGNSKWLLRERLRRVRISFDGHFTDEDVYIAPKGETAYPLILGKPALARMGFQMLSPSGKPLWTKDREGHPLKSTVWDPDDPLVRIQSPLPFEEKLSGGLTADSEQLHSAKANFPKKKVTIKEPPDFACRSR